MAGISIESLAPRIQHLETLVLQIARLLQGYAPMAHISSENRASRRALGEHVDPLYSSTRDRRAFFHGGR